MLTLLRRISCLSTTTKNKASCLMESLNSLWMQWGNRCQQPSASLDTRGELNSFTTRIQTLCLVRKKCHAQHYARRGESICLYFLASAHPQPTASAPSSSKLQHLSLWRTLDFVTMCSKSPAFCLVPAMPKKSFTVWRKNTLRIFKNWRSMARRLRLHRLWAGKVSWLNRG